MFGSVLVGLLHGCCNRSPSRDVLRICTRLHIHAALLHTVIKGTLELMNSGVATEALQFGALSHTFNGHSYRPVLGAASRLQ